MRSSTIGDTGIEVTRACLGTMTWGNQNSIHDAHAQLDLATGRGVNIVDTAEMYPIPPAADSYGSTETMIGEWFAAQPARRDRVFLMSKIVGTGLPWIRNGSPITADSIQQAIDGSLRRLQTDVIDLYQLHWPNRANPHFNRHMPGSIGFDPARSEREEAELLQLMQALNAARQAGKIRYYGLSNDSPWGLMTMRQLAAEHQLPAPVSVQNEFSLIHAKDWPYLAETCSYTNTAYFPWSPLGGGVLSGKYLDGTPDGTRWSLNNRHGNFRDTEAVAEAVTAYQDVAKEAGLTPAQLALAWCDQFPWVTSTIIGATSLEQLTENLDAFDQPLDEDTLTAVNAVFRRYPMPF